MGSIHEFHLQEFVSGVQNGVYGIKSGEIAGSKEVASIFDTAAKTDNDGNDEVLSTDNQGFRELVQQGVNFVKQFFGIQDSEIQQKEQELASDIESVMSEYTESYKKTVESNWSNESYKELSAIGDTLYDMIHSLNNEPLKKEFFAKLDAAKEEIKQAHKAQSAEAKPAAEEPAEAGPKAIHVLDQEDSSKAKEGDYAVKDNNTYKFTNGEWVQIKTQ